MSRRKPDATLSAFPVVIELPVLWGHMDAFQHVNNVEYFRYFESARIAYFEKMGVVGDRGVGTILAHTSCRFRAPLTYPDTIRVGGCVTDVGTDRFTMDYAVASEKLGRVAATGDGVVVSFDYEAGEKAPLPNSWLDAIRSLEGVLPGR